MMEDSMQTTLEETQLGFIGVGNMGEAIISGLLREGTVKASRISGTARSEKSVNRIQEKLGINGFTDNRELARNSDVIVLAVKWDVIESVLSEIADELTENKLVISIAGAMTTTFIEQRLRNKVPVVLAIPNSPCAVNAGLTLICAGAHASARHIHMVETIFHSLGATLPVTKTTMDTFIALTSSGPAFFYLIVEAMAQAGVGLGIPHGASRMATAQAMLGAAKMLLESDQHPAQLRDKIATPGGCTIAGLNELEQGNIRATLINTIEATVHRLGELRQSMGTA
jgi:pyrroline-5-carboxylate reductase